MALLAAFAMPLLFELGCAAMAAASVLLAGRGSKLQSLSIFTFVPALYLACEVAEGAAPHELARHGLAFLPFLAIALIPALLMSAFDHVCTRDTEVSQLHHFRRILHWSELGVRSFYGEAAHRCRPVSRRCRPDGRMAASRSRTVGDLVGRQRRYR
jgi:hypothetical protein